MAEICVSHALSVRFILKRFSLSIANLRKPTEVGEILTGTIRDKNIKLVFVAARQTLTVISGETKSRILQVCGLIVGCPYNS